MKTVTPKNFSAICPASATVNGLSLLLQVHRSGKSTLAEKLELNPSAKVPDYAAGCNRGRALETFDIDGFIHTLGRLRSNVLTEVAVPVFDRAGWNELRFDTSVSLAVSREILRQQLVNR